LEGGGTIVASVVERGFDYGQHKFNEVKVGRGEKILAGIAKIILATVTVPSDIL
jgi:hypothetical protein